MGKHVHVRSTRRIHVRLLRVFIFTNQREQKQIRRGEKKKESFKIPYQEEIRRCEEKNRYSSGSTLYTYIQTTTNTKQEKKQNIIFTKYLMMWIMTLIYLGNTRTTYP